jgi:hypothetical protein
VASIIVGIVLALALVVAFIVNRQTLFPICIGLVTIVAVVGLAVAFGEPQARREVLVWLVAGVVLGGVFPAFFHLLTLSPATGLRFVSELDLPATALAAGAFGQLVVRRGVRDTADLDIILVLLSLLGVIITFTLAATNLADKQLPFTGTVTENLAVAAHLGGFAWVILTGGACVYLSAQSRPPPMKESAARGASGV